MLVTVHTGDCSCWNVNGRGVLTSTTDGDKMHHQTQFVSDALFNRQPVEITNRGK